MVRAFDPAPSEAALQTFGGVAPGLGVPDPVPVTTAEHHLPPSDHSERIQDALRPSSIVVDPGEGREMRDHPDAAERRYAQRAPFNGPAGAQVEGSVLTPQVTVKGDPWQTSAFSPAKASENSELAAVTAAALPPTQVIATAPSSAVTILAQEASSLLRRTVVDVGRDPATRAGTTLAAAQGIPVESGQATWYPAGASVGVAGASIVGGLVYVGRRLPSPNNSSEPDNCLIDPGLTVAKRADVVQPLPYWPSYGRITPGWRRAYLDFLAGSRSDPNTPIGLVFLYFYGLERRAMLDRATSEADAITAEVRRLVAVFGGNNSFRHYAEELIAALDLLRAGDDWTPSFEPAMVVPVRLRVALGRRAAEGRPVDADLLLAVTMSHPETRVRTPARRALPILRGIFANKLAEAHPSGLVVKRVKTMKALSLPYRAASNSFAVDVHPAGDRVPDVLARDEPLATGRRFLDACTDELDAYSRDLGRLAGASPTLAITSRLPAAARREAAAALPGAPLAALERMCTEGSVDLVALQCLLGLPPGTKATRARASEAAMVLAKFGFGLVPDPAYTMRVGKNAESVVVFALGRAHDETPPCSEAYRSAHLSLVLGVMVALADGEVDAREREALLAIGRQPAELSPDESRRLAADLAWLEANPAMLGDLKAHLAGLSDDARRHLLDVAIRVSMADDVVNAREVSVLERIGRQLGLDPSAIYSRLHGARTATSTHPDDELQEVVAPDPRRPTPASASIAGAPSTDAGLDRARLAAIRNETLGITKLLGEIFAEDEETPAPAVVAPPTPATVGREGLDARHAALLEELSAREEWAAVDFERLVREAGLMPGPARDALNEWSLDRHDELLIEGDDPVVVNLDLVMEGA